MYFLLVLFTFIHLPRAEKLDERSNYASFDCGAKVVSFTKGMTSVQSILNENKDSYMTSLCSIAKQQIVIELCQEVKVDSLAIANFEYFSSMVHVFRLYGSDKHVGKEASWTFLDEIKTENNRNFQVLLLLILRCLDYHTL